MSLTVGSLFAGIGGFDLGFQRAGFDIAWQVEIDDYCRKVLAKHWPDVPRYEDIRDCDETNLAPVDVICGGFPCQDLSVAGQQKGLINGQRSSLWFEMLRIVRLLRPGYVVIENVPGLYVHGLDIVVQGLAQSGYACEWQTISAQDAGAPHLRKRVWIVAYAQCTQRWQSEPGGYEPNGQDAQWQEAASGVSPSSKNGRERIVADAPSQRAQGHGTVRQQEPCPHGQQTASRRCRDYGKLIWATEPDVGRVAHGVPHRVDRLRGLGNAIVPQIAEYIAYCILEHEYGS